MRIISGHYSGKRLQSPQNKDIRPTSDKVRGALFNMLAARGALDGAHVLDAFCGSGALGLEALSRGAGHCHFFDNSAQSLSLARSNSEHIGAQAHATFRKCDALAMKPRQNNHLPFDLIFLDPPYHQDLVSKALDTLNLGNWLKEGSWIVCETEKNASITTMQHMLTDDTRAYGNIQITLLRYTPITPE